MQRSISRKWAYVFVLYIPLFLGTILGMTGIFAEVFFSHMVANGTIEDNGDVIHIPPFTSVTPTPSYDTAW